MAINWDEIKRKGQQKGAAAEAQVNFTRAVPSLPKAPPKPLPTFQSVLDEYNTSLPGIGNQIAKNLAPERKQEIAQGTQRFFEKAPVQAGFMERFSLNSPVKSLSGKLGVPIDTSGAKNSIAFTLKGNPTPRASILPVYRQVYKPEEPKDIDVSYYGIGEAAGTMAQFALPYAGASGGIGSLTAKALPSLGKIGQNVVKSVATDLAVGLPLNTNIALGKEGLRGTDALKNIALNTGIDLITGGILEVAPLILKSGKKIKSKADFDNLPPAEKTEVVSAVESVADSSKVFKNPEEAMAYLDDLKAQGKNPTVKVNNAGTVNTEYVISNGKPQPLPQATTKPVQPILPQKGTEISKEQPFAKMGDLPKANSELGKLGKIYQQTVDNQYAIGKATKGITQTADKDAKILASNARNARGTAEYAIKEALTDMEGRKVTDVGLESLLLRPKSEQAAFEDYLLNKHNIARFKQGKAVFGDQINDKMSAKAVADYEAQYPQFKGLSEGINDFNGKVIDNWLVGSGLISEDLGKLLKQMYPDYVPTFREGGVPGKQFNTKGLTPGQVVKQAVGGNKPIMALTKSYPAVVEKAIKSARKNEVYLGLLDAVEKNPDKMARWAKIVEPTADKTMKDATLIAQSNDLIQQNGLDAIEQISNKMLEIDSAAGKYYATAMKNGKPVRMEIHKDLFDGLESMNRIGNEGQLDGMAAAVRKYATNPFKALITGYNPIFAVKNIFRDIPTAYIQGTENNPIKFIGNLAKAGKSIAKNDTQYQEFIAMGGRKGGFFDAEKGLRIESIPTKALKAGAEKIGAFNNLTETLPRYGEYLGTLKREGGDYAAKQKGIYNAGEVTVNFGRQGDKTKALDSVVPYLNPAVQGIDKAIRNLRNPLTYAKGVAAVTAPATALYMLNQSVDKKAYDQLDNRTKDTNYLIPMGNGEFIKIPKSRESGVLFGSLFERLYRLAEGQEESFKGYGTTVRTNFAPMNPFENNILTPATLNLATNKDFADRAIVPGNMTNEGYGDSRSKYLQFDEQSSEIAKWIGEQAKNLPGLEEGLSPKQIDYLIRSYTGIVGQILQPATTKGGSPFENIIKRGFTADSIYNNEIQNNFYEKYDDAKRIKSDLNINEDIPSDYITPEEKRISVYAEASKAMSELRKQEKELTAKGATDARLKQIRQQILDIAEKTPAEAEKVYEQYKKTYIPELSMMSEKQISTYKTMLRPKGVTPQQYRNAYLSQKDYTTNVRKAIALNGNEKMYEAFEIKDNYVAMGNAIKQSGLTQAYDSTYAKLKGVTGSEEKKYIIDSQNFGLSRDQLILLYEAFDVSQGTGRYKRQFN